MKNEMKLVLMTGARAKELLQNNSGNRPLRKDVVARFCRIIRNGEWVLNGSSIVVAEAGRLLDGQHRLAAIQETDIPCPVYVLSGVPEEYFKTIDCDGAGRRTAGDLLHFLGITSSHRTAAIGKSLLMLKAKSYNIKPTNQDILDCVTNTEGVRYAVSLPTRTVDGRPLICCFAAAIAWAQPVNYAGIARFVQAVSQNDARVGTGAHALLTRMGHRGSGAIVKSGDQSDRWQLMLNTLRAIEADLFQQQVKLMRDQSPSVLNRFDKYRANPQPNGKLGGPVA